MASGTESLLARLPLRAGALVGALAYLLGYLVTYLLAVERIRAELAKMDVNAALSLFGSGGVQPWQVAGWVFYGAHFVEVSVTSSMMDLSTDAINESAGDGRVLLFLLPPLLLLAAGVLAARLAGARRRTVAAAAGLTVLPGYFALIFVGAFLTQATVVIAAVGPDLTTALAAGFLYPLAFGPLGGVLAATVQQSRASNSPHGSNP